MIEPADVIALIEDGPQSQSDLTIWLGRPDLSDEGNARHVKRALNALRRAGHIKQVGAARKWALASYLAPTGRPRVHPKAVLVVSVPVVRPAVFPQPPVSVARFEHGQQVRTVDGIDYEVFTLDDLQAAQAQHWPSRGGSSLGGETVHLQIIR